MKRYGLYEDAPRPKWRGFFANLKSAKIEGHKLADKEQLVCFIFCFDRMRVVAMFEPSQRKQPNHAQRVSDTLG